MLIHLAFNLQFWSFVFSDVKQRSPALFHQF
jgi:hypothetical protein